MDDLLGALLEELGIFSLSEPVEALLEGRIQGVVGDIRTANVALSGLVSQDERNHEAYNAQCTQHRTRPQPLIRAL